jgi:hypothetical protein
MLLLLILGGIVDHYYVNIQGHHVLPSKIFVDSYDKVHLYFIKKV